MLDRRKISLVRMHCGSNGPPTTLASAILMRKYYLKFLTRKLTFAVADGVLYVACLRLRTAIESKCRLGSVYWATVSIFR